VFKKAAPKVRSYLMPLLMQLRRERFENKRTNNLIKDLESGTKHAGPFRHIGFELRPDFSGLRPTKSPSSANRLAFGSGKADQNPYVLRTPGLLKMCLNGFFLIFHND